MLIAAAWARAGQGERVLPAGRLHRHAVRIARPVGLSNARGSYPAGRRDYPPFGIRADHHRVSFSQTSGRFVKAREVYGCILTRSKPIMADGSGWLWTMPPTTTTKERHHAPHATR